MRKKQEPPRFVLRSYQLSLEWLGGCGSWCEPPDCPRIFWVPTTDGAIWELWGVTVSPLRPNRRGYFLVMGAVMACWRRSDGRARQDRPSFHRPSHWYASMPSVASRSVSP